MENELLKLTQSVPLETKLTRSELMDVILDEMESDLNSARERLVTEEESLKRLTDIEASDLIRVNGVKFKVELTWDGKVRLEFCTGSGSVQVKPTPVVKDKVKRLSQISEEKQAFQSLREQVTNNRSKAKTALLKKFLEGSAEGRNILDLISEFRISLQKKLLPAARKLP